MSIQEKNGVLWGVKIVGMAAKKRDFAKYHNKHDLTVTNAWFGYDGENHSD